MVLTKTRVLGSNQKTRVLESNQKINIFNKKRETIKDRKHFERKENNKMKIF